MSKQQFELNGLATAIGSLPHIDPQQACSVVLANLPEIPHWPQLPQRSFLENMYAQFSERFPGIVLDNNNIYIDRSRDLSEELEKLYTAFIEDEGDYGSLGLNYAEGFYTFLNKFNKRNVKAVKGQITGPISFGLTITDQNRRPLLYDDVLAEALAKHLRMKAKWQEQKLQSICSTTIISIDEPYLSSVGSGFISISRKQVTDLLEEVMGGLNGLKMIHCCGNTDWAVLLNTSVDILSFDAYEHSEALSLYPSEVKSFLDRGGVLAWGIVPNIEQDISREIEENVLHRLSKAMKSLSKKGIDYDIIRSHCLITPSCGLGAVSVDSAIKALELTYKVSQSYRSDVYSKR